MAFQDNIFNYLKLSHFFRKLGIYLTGVINCVYDVFMVLFEA